MRLHTSIQKATLWLTTLLCVGCGGAASDEGVPRSMPLNELSDEEALTVCRKVVDSLLLPRELVMQGHRFGCKRDAFSDALSAQPSSEAELRRGCQSAYDECLVNNPPPQEAPGDEDCPLRETTCAATVGDYEDCWEATPSWFRERVEAKPGCSTLTLASDPTDFTTAPVPPPPVACQRVIATCGPEMWVDREGGE